MMTVRARIMSPLHEHLACDSLPRETAPLYPSIGRIHHLANRVRLAPGGRDSCRSAGLANEPLIQSGGLSNPPNQSDLVNQIDRLAGRLLLSFGLLTSATTCTLN